jgi:transposase
MSRDFDRVCAEDGRSSVPPERLVRSLVLQMLYSIRSERLLMEQLDHNLLFRWFVGLSIDELRHARVHGRPAGSRSRGRSRASELLAKAMVRRPMRAIASG